MGIFESFCRAGELQFRLSPSFAPLTGLALADYLLLTFLALGLAALLSLFTLGGLLTWPDFPDHLCLCCVGLVGVVCLVTAPNSRVTSFASRPHGLPPSIAVLL